ncbi:MAG: hypothetical protein VR72_07225 [Clostridiaceae bacterium BRH_c20a]|nr:MAG: hypothetical protein VR72_07225 [Clostridiaceae bacterium BRH_c20a]
MDRNIRGMIAGAIGGITMNIWSFFSYHALGFAKLRFPDWSSLMIFEKKPESLSMFIIALLTQLAWSGFLGALFAHAIPLISSKGYLIKGAFYGFLASFLIYVIPTLFQHPIHEIFDFGTVVTDIIGGVIWGITTVVVLKYLDDKITTKV